MSSVISPRFVRALALVVASVGAATAHAQATERTVRGLVTTADGVPLIAAGLWVIDTALVGDTVIAATTGDDGHFRFTLPIRPTSALLVRRLGFADQRVSLGDLRKKQTDLRTIALSTTITPAITVAVRDSGAFTGPSAQYYRHLSSGGGQYVTYSQLQHSSTRTSNALRLLPGITLVPTGSGGGSVRLRGRNCYASVWIDGSPLGSRAYDVDGIPAASLLGIEFYGTGSNPPIEFQTPESSACGALAFWTLRRDALSMPDQGVIRDIASLRLGIPVDEKARLGESIVFAPTYPDEARSAGVGGPVLVELVVDTLGFIERSSVSVVAAAAPELGEPAREAALRLRFIPARVGGVAVRQLVHIVARFEPSHTPKTRR